MDACERIAEFLEREAFAEESSENMIANDDEGITDEPLVVVENGTFVVGGKTEDDSYDGDDELLKNDESTNLNQRTFTLSGVNKSLKKTQHPCSSGTSWSGKIYTFECADWRRRIY